MAPGDRAEKEEKGGEKVSAISILDVVAAPADGALQQGASDGVAGAFGPFLQAAIESAPGGPEGLTELELMQLLAAFSGPAQAAPQCIETLQAVLAGHQAAGVDAQGVVNALGLALQRFQATEGLPEDEMGEAHGSGLEAVLTLASAIFGPEVVEAAMEQIQAAAPAEVPSSEALSPAPQQAAAMPPVALGRNGLPSSPGPQGASDAAEPQAAPAAGYAGAAEGAAPAEPQEQSADVRPAADTPAAPNAGVQDSRNATVEPVTAAQAAPGAFEEAGEADVFIVEPPQAGEEASSAVAEASRQRSAPQQQSAAPAASAGTAEFMAAAAPPQAKRPAGEQDMLVQTGEKLLQAVEAAVSTSQAAASGTDAVVQTASEVDQQRMIDRIANAVSHASDSGRTTVRLRLYPPALGTVRIEVSSVRGAVTVRIETSTSAAHQALNANLGALRESLSSAGVDMRGVEVNYRNPSAHLGLGQQRRDSGEYEPQGRRSWSQSSPSQEAEDAWQPLLQTVSAGLLDVLM